MGLMKQCPYCKKWFRPSNPHWWGCPKDPAYNPEIFE